MKIFFTIVALFAMVPTLATATTVTLSSTSTGPSVLTSVLNLVPNGSLISVGTFIGGIETLANWREFGVSTVKSVGIAPNAKPSKVAGSVANNGGEADDTQFNGLAVYVWIYNSATVSLTADQGIFKSTSLFPVNDLASAADAVTVAATNFTAGTAAIVGFTNAQFVANGDNKTGNATGGQFILGTAVPEISTSLLIFSVLGLAAIRRRR